LAATAPLVSASRAETTVGDVRVSGDVSVRRVIWPQTTTVDVVVTLRAGASPAPLQLKLAPPTVHSRAMRAERQEGSLLAWSGEPEQAGLSRFAPVSILSGLPGCSPRAGSPHGSDLVQRSYDVALNPGAVATIVAHFRVNSDTAPWPSADFRPTVTISAANPAPGTEPTLVRLPKTAISGITGTEIRLESPPRLSPAPARAVRSLRRGQAIELRGSTSPPLRAR